MKKKLNTSVYIKFILKNTTMPADTNNNKPANTTVPNVNTLPALTFSPKGNTRIAPIIVNRPVMATMVRRKLFF